MRLLVPILLLGGCAPAASSEDASGNVDTDTDPSVGDTDPTDDIPPIEATYWSLDGQLEVASNNVVIGANSVLTVQYWEDGKSQCTTTLSISNASARTSPGSVTAFGWWVLTVAEDVPNTCAGQRPADRLTMGIGALDSPIVAAVRAAGLTENVYGVYLREPTNTQVIYVYGAASDDGFVGATPPVQSGSLPDGTYAVRGLHLLPLFDE